jgi:hypothetical protein
MRGDICEVFGGVGVVTWPGLWMLAHALMVRASSAFTRKESAGRGIPSGSRGPLFTYARRFSRYPHQVVLTMCPPLELTI